MGPNWVIPIAIYGVFWPITRHMWSSLPANCVSPKDIFPESINPAEAKPIGTLIVRPDGVEARR